MSAAHPPTYDFTDKAQAPMAPPNGYAGPPAPSVQRQFPPAFNLYRISRFGKSYALGEHQERPLYAVSVHAGWSGEPDVVLHNGPGEEQAVLASFNSSSFSRKSTVSLPPLEPGGGTEEHVQREGFAHPVWSFELEVPAASGNGLRREPFEWRNSHGETVSALGGSRGRKLVRLVTDGGYAGGATASGGGEVVAVCSHSNWTGHKCFLFEFVGSGASGALGERWAVMAVISALGIWNNDQKQKRAAAAGGGAGA